VTFEETELTVGLFYTYIKIICGVNAIFFFTHNFQQKNNFFSGTDATEGSYNKSCIFKLTDSVLTLVDLEHLNILKA